MFSNLKSKVVSFCKGGLIAGAAAVPVLSSAPAHAALSAEVEAMITAAEAGFTDVASAISSLGISAVGVAIALVVVALVITFVRSGGSGR